MRSTLLIAVCASALALGSCGQETAETVEHVTTMDIEEPAPENEYGFSQTREAAAPPPPPPAPASKAIQSAEAAADFAEESVAESGGLDAGIPVGTPQIAYRYAYGFRVPSDAIKPLQERHADMCEARGPDVCRIISMRQADNEGDYGYGSLQIAVASKEARSFGKELSDASGQVDGELVSSSIDGEDLSKRIVDTEARLRARTMLRDRLMEVLRTRKGTVSELVQAERGVAQVNEEIDQAQSWLTEMRGRVAFSQMQLTYETGSRSSGGFIDPIREAAGSVGKILGSMVAFVILALTILIPIGLVVWLLSLAWRRSGANGWLPTQKPASTTEASVDE